ncbi:transposase [Desulfococcaceae bacterium HSG7]|nr:transposase [Desulfococcaceae bacterium HSG7]
MTYPPITSLFCDVDDFSNEFEPWYNLSLITLGMKKRNKPYSMSLSVIMTIVVLSHCSDYRTFKKFYTGFIKEYHAEAFPDPVSYNRFIELKGSALIPLCSCLNQKKGWATGIAFVDSTSIKVSDNRRTHSHKVFKSSAKRGKNSTGRHYGFKLHLIISRWKFDSV